MTSILCKARRARLPCLLAAASLAAWLASSTALGQSAVIDDWARECETAGEFADRCFIRQSLTLNATGQRLFEIAAGYPLGGQYPLLLLSVPLGTYLPGGIVMEVDDTGAHRAVVAYCNTEGCHAYYRMTEPLYRMFRQGRWLNVQFVDGTRRTTRFQVSLNGFSNAIDSLPRP